MWTNFTSDVTIRYEISYHVIDVLTYDMCVLASWFI